MPALERQNDRWYARPWLSLGPRRGRARRGLWANRRGRVALAPRGSALHSVARVIAASVAAFELRCLIQSAATAAAGLQCTVLEAAQPTIAWSLLLLAAGACLLLYQIGRDLVGRLPRPRWSVALVAFWLVCSLGLFALLRCQTALFGLHAGGHPAGPPGALLGPAPWSSLAVALAAGLALASSLQCAWRLVCQVTRMWGHRLSRWWRQGLVATHLAVSLAPPVAEPLLAGWSDRGPPGHRSRWLSTVDDCVAAT